MSETLSRIERHTQFMLSETTATTDEFRQMFQKSNIIHDLRWLSPEMEFMTALCGMEALHISPEWSHEMAQAARMYLEGVEMFLEGVRLGYRIAQNEEAKAA